MLGAGFDTLGLTLLHADAELLVVELDRPAMIEAKELALAAAKIARPWPAPWPSTWATCARSPVRLPPPAGARSEPALFIAELALEYLEPGAAFAVLSALGTICGPSGAGSRCTIRFGDVDDDQLAAAAAATGEPMRFRPLSAELPGLLARAGLARPGLARSDARAHRRLGVPPPGDRRRHAGDETAP